MADGTVQAVRNAGLSDVEILEKLAIVVPNTFTNYVNAPVKIEVGFSAAPLINQLTVGGASYERGERSSGQVRGAIVPGDCSFEHGHGGRRSAGGGQ